MRPGCRTVVPWCRQVLGGAEQRKDRMGALCAVNLGAVFRDSASVEVLVAGSSGLGRVLWFGKRWQELGLGIEKTDSR